MRHSYVTPERPAFSPRCCPVVPTCVSARHIAKYARKTRCSNLNAGWAPDDADNIFNASNRVKGRRLRSQSSHRVRRRMRTGTPKTPLLLTKWCPSRLFPSVAGRWERHVPKFPHTISSEIEASPQGWVFAVPTVCREVQHSLITTTRNFSCRFWHLRLGGYCSPP